jgi:hypothetical protein
MPELRRFGGWAGAATLCSLESFVVTFSIFHNIRSITFIKNCVHPMLTSICFTYVSLLCVCSRVGARAGAILKFPRSRGHKKMTRLHRVSDHGSLVINFDRIMFLDLDPALFKWLKLLISTTINFYYSLQFKTE